MFRCYFCKQITPPKTPKQSVIIAKREKLYPTRRKEAKGGRGGGRFRPREGAVQDQGGKGIEIAQEVAACPACAAKHHEAEVIAAPVPVEVDGMVAASDTAPASEGNASPDTQSGPSNESVPAGESASDAAPAATEAAKAPESAAE